MKQTLHLKVEVTPQRFCTPMGWRESYGVKVNGKPIKVFDTMNEVEAFKRGVKVDG